MDLEVVGTWGLPDEDLTRVGRKKAVYGVSGVRNGGLFRPRFVEGVPPSKGNGVAEADEFDPMVGLGADGVVRAHVERDCGLLVADPAAVDGNRAFHLSSCFLDSSRGLDFPSRIA